MSHRTSEPSRCTAQTWHRVDQEEEGRNYICLKNHRNLRQTRNLLATFLTFIQCFWLCAKDCNSVRKIKQVDGNHFLLTIMLQYLHRYTLTQHLLTIQLG